MFKVKIGEDEYEVSFQHYVPSDTQRDNFHDPNIFRETFGTVCYIEKPEYIITGISDLSIKDNYNRNVGRKVSLTKALKELFPNEPEQRKLFWDAYYKARGGKW